MSKFNVNVRVKPDTTNVAGGKAFSMSPEMELVHAVLTSFLKDEFYEKGSDRVDRIKKLVALNDPQFVAKLAIVARKEFNLRSVSHVLLGELSKVHRGDSLVKDAIVEAALRPDDLTEIVAYVKTPLPKQVKRGVRNAILKFDRYQLAKYKGEGKGVTLVDLFNLTHPKTKHADAEQKKAWKDLIEGNLASFDTWETEISNAKDDKARTKAWEALIKENKMGYMALLRNLNNLIKYGVGEKVLDMVAKKLSDPVEVAKSKQLPFRFVTAYDNVHGNRVLTDAIADAMEHALSNVPTLPGKTLIAIDSSGSMSGDPMKKASIFGAALAKANKNSDVILYDTDVKELANFNSKTPVIDLSKSIERQAMGGGTETSLVFQYAIAKKIRYDRVIILSDNESWTEGWRGNSVQDFYKAYRGTGADPFVYAIDIQGYGTSDVKGGKVFHLCGWSERLLDFIGRIEEGESLVDYIKNYQIKSMKYEKPKKAVTKKVVKVVGKVKKAVKRKR